MVTPTTPTTVRLFHIRSNRLTISFRTFASVIKLHITPKAPAQRCFGCFSLGFFQGGDPPTASCTFVRSHSVT